MSELHLSRRKHTKTRLGCQICKRRHIRCDGHSPVCFNCLRAGHSCPGYTVPDKIVRDRSKMKFRGFVFHQPQRPPSAVTALNRAASSASVSCDFFRTKSLPLLSRNFEAHEIIFTLLSSLGTESFLGACCLALASIHRFEHDLALQTPRQSDAQALVSTERGQQALKDYGTALRCFPAVIGDGVSPPADVILGCMLLSTFESIRGSTSAMAAHMHAATTLLGQTTTSEHNEIASATMLMSTGHALFGRSRDTFAPLPSRRQVSSCTPSIPSVTEIANAVHYLVYLVDESADNSPRSYEHYYRSLRLQFQYWQTQFEASVPSVTEPRPHTTPSISLALAGFWMASIFLDCYPLRRQTAYDQYTLSFRRALAFIEHALQNSSELTPDTFSWEPGTIALLFYISVYCRDSTIRRQAITLLRKCPQREGPWDATKVESIARLALDHEENGRVSADTCPEGIPEECRVQTLLFGDAVGAGKIIMRVKSGEIHRRTQDLSS